MLEKLKKQYLKSDRRSTQGIGRPKKSRCRESVCATVTVDWGRPAKTRMRRYRF